MPAAGRVRDFIGYGRKPPDPRWPKGARLALVIVLNVEEGAEPSIPDGDSASELALTDANPGEVPTGTRDLVAESLWEYGSRVGFWRLYELFVERGVPITINACSQALERLVAQHRDVWCAGRSEVARHWIAEHPPEVSR